MLEFVRGRVESVSATQTILDVAGIGLRVESGASATRRWQVGAEETIEVEMVVREDSWTLFGFADKDDRDVFRLLLTVSGIGPRTAAAIVDNLGAAGLRAVLASGETKELLAVPGIGKKSAQRLLLELADKLPEVQTVDVTATAVGELSWRADVEAGLTSLGWSAREVAVAVSTVIERNPEPTRLTVSSAMRAALQELGSP